MFEGYRPASRNPDNLHRPYDPVHGAATQQPSPVSHARPVEQAGAVAADRAVADGHYVVSPAGARYSGRTLLAVYLQRDAEEAVDTYVSC